jgi:hypothetical protein
MATMIDEIFDRGYQAGRTQLNGSLMRGFGSVSRAVLNAFDVLNRIEYQAPWASVTKRVRHN